MVILKLGFLAVFIFHFVAAPLCAVAADCHTVPAVQSMPMAEVQHNGHSQEHYQSVGDHDHQDHDQSCDHCDQSLNAVVVSSCGQQDAEQVLVNGSNFNSVVEDVISTIEWRHHRVGIHPPAMALRSASSDLWQKTLRIRL